MGKFTAFNLPLKTLSAGTHEFEYKLNREFFAEMEYSEVRDADLDVQLKVVYRNDIYALSFQIKGTLTLLCDRCLDDLVIDVDTTYSINVEYGDEFNDESDDLLIIPTSDNNLNISDMLFDTAVLEIPIKHVHPEGECNPGMSEILAQHRATMTDDDDFDIDNEACDIEALDDDTAPIDPRWAALKGLAGKTENDN